MVRDQPHAFIYTRNPLFRDFFFHFHFSISLCVDNMGKRGAKCKNSSLREFNYAAFEFHFHLPLKKGFAQL